MCKVPGSYGSSTRRPIVLYSKLAKTVPVCNEPCHKRSLDTPGFSLSSANQPLSYPSRSGNSLSNPFFPSLSSCTPHRFILFIKIRPSVKHMQRYNTLVLTLSQVLTSCWPTGHLTAHRPACLQQFRQSRTGPSLWDSPLPFMKKREPDYKK